MKKFLVLMIILAAAASGITLLARDPYTRDTAVLPQAALSIIKNNFKAEVSVIKIDKNLGRINEYEVVLTDGTEIKFDRHGNWEDIECAATSSVPAKLVPENIMSYVKKNQKGSRIIGIEKDRKGYDVELSNGLDLKFDGHGAFVRYD